MCPSPADEHGLSKYAIRTQYLDQVHRGGHGGCRRAPACSVYSASTRITPSDSCPRTRSANPLFDLPITLRQNRTFSYLYVNDLGPIVEQFLVGHHAEAAYNVVPDWTDDLMRPGAVGYKHSVGQGPSDPRWRSPGTACHIAH